MKKTIITTLIFLSFFNLYSQEVKNQTYSILEIPFGIDAALYEIALSNSDFECFRFESKDRVLIFDSGLKITLFSRNKVIQNGVAQNKNCFINDDFIPNEYLLKLFNDKIVIKAPYDINDKRNHNEE
ncbi:MAG: hypothetical protein HYR91_14555 [Flavobacteriia bacterium]|nr:hypothetical protein [Flavobacteriia bacterium]